MDFIQRHIEDIILKTDSTFKGILLTGARQTGKSTLLRKLFSERRYVALDDPFIGKEKMEKLAGARVAVFGIGGYVCETLVRSGVGAFDQVIDDKVCLTNLNRQIIATRKTVGQYKAEVMEARMKEINPDTDIRMHKCFFLPENADDFPFAEYDYIVDAVDTVTAKLALVMKAQELHIPIA